MTIRPHVITEGVRPEPDPLRLIEIADTVAAISADDDLSDAQVRVVLRAAQIIEALAGRQAMADLARRNDPNQAELQDLSGQISAAAAKAVKIAFGR